MGASVISVIIARIVAIHIVKGCFERVRCDYTNTNVINYNLLTICSFVRLIANLKQKNFHHHH